MTITTKLFIMAFIFSFFAWMTLAGFYWAAGPAALGLGGIFYLGTKN